MGMKKLFVIGGMGAGKSTARKVLAEQGVPYIDLDKVGHDVLLWDTVKADLVEAFGADILGADGQIVRSKVAAKAFATPAETRKLNRITLPRIEESFTDQVDELARAGHKAVVVEYSVFKNRQTSLAYDADVVIAVLAPIDMRIQRAVASGWEETDVRRRIAQQITDADRIEAADVVFVNDGTPEEMRNQVMVWWDDYKKTL
ncbi:dephospho-CoA kinase [Senegalimassilia anaerobia]|uniref:dephospho-CoA kinase n=1 Tax=Senegalimassilia anaerobia TaxID=1473216 RepID=UPI003A978FAF